MITKIYSHLEFHLSQIEDEAIALVEAVPAHRNLSGPDDPSAAHVEKTRHVRFAGSYVFKPRSNPPLLKK